MSGFDPCSIGEGRCEAETELAILVVIDGEEIWIPKSVVHDDSEVWEKYQEGDMVVQRWWAEDKGLA